MRKLIGAMILTSFAIIGFCNATVEDVKSDGTYTVGPGGCVE